MNELTEGVNGTVATEYLTPIHMKKHIRVSQLSYKKSKAGLQATIDKRVKETGVAQPILNKNEEPKAVKSLS